MKTVFVSSGQGSFQPGMGKLQYERIPAFRAAFDEISDRTKEDLPSLCWGALRVKVKNDPYYSHVALWGTSYAMFKTLEGMDLRPDLLLGHSLGEIISYCLSGALSVGDSCKLLAYRGELFARNKETSESDLVAVVGEPENIETLIVRNPEGSGVYTANYNTPKQVVFAVALRSLEDFTEQARGLGLRTILLKVGNGCHSPHVADIHTPLADFIEGLSIGDALHPVFSCVESQVLSTRDQIKNTLKKHLLSPVKWWESLDSMVRGLGSQYRIVDLSFSNTVRGLVLGWSPEAPIVQAETLVGALNAG